MHLVHPAICSLCVPCPPLDVPPPFVVFSILAGRIGHLGDVTSVLVARCRVVAVLFRSVAMFSRVMGRGGGTGWQGSALVVPFRVVGGGRGGVMVSDRD